MTKIASTSRTPMPCSEAWKACAVPWKVPMIVDRHTHLRGRLPDLRDRLRERHAGLQVEGERHRRELAEMVHCERADRGLERRHGVERHQRAGVRAHVEQRQQPRDRSGSAARAPSRPSTGWSARRSSTPAASRRRRRACSRSSAPRRRAPKPCCGRSRQSPAAA